MQSLVVVLSTFLNYGQNTLFLKECDTLTLCKELRQIKTEADFVTLLHSYEISSWDHFVDYAKTIFGVLTWQTHSAYLHTKNPEYLDSLKFNINQLTKSKELDIPNLRYHLLTTQFLYNDLSRA